MRLHELQRNESNDYQINHARKMDIASLETSVELGAIRSSDETIGATNSKIKKRKKKRKKVSSKQGQFSLLLPFHRQEYYIIDRSAYSRSHASMSTSLVHEKPRHSSRCSSRNISLHRFPSTDLLFYATPIIRDRRHSGK